ncbi:regulatory protein RecX [mine drainage metagenome]|uniref:Regulatory protein RecX n=1 Tax=mine drainage metagenome TaxID=410659 RepID=A0A1J5PZ30_9ZZZZ
MRKATPSLRERALGYLTRREYSRQELSRKLQAHVVDEDLDALLDEFRQRGWLSDARYADQLVHARQGRYGSLKVAHELRSKGVSDELVSQAVAELKLGEKESALNLWRRKFGTVAQSREEWARQARFLQSRGFGTDIIKAVLRGEPEEME